MTVPRLRGRSRLQRPPGSPAAGPPGGGPRSRPASAGLIIYNRCVYYLSFFLFGVGGLLLNLFCALVFWLPDTPGRERNIQRLIHRHFALWIWWLRQTRLFFVRFEGLERLPRGGAVLVANHPGLMDITYLLSQIPEAVCVFKPSIRHNPVLGIAARLAGYLANDGGPDMIRAAGAKAADGHMVIIFPEGTRTLEGALNPLKAGFALVAQRGGVPIQTVLIRCDSNVLVKGQRWWKVPRLPTQVTVTLGPRFPAPEVGDTASLVTEVEAWFRGALGDWTARPRNAVAAAADA
jgi:1-acyl-sn-glycerol-3-phosphate acyltransferase